MKNISLCFLIQFIYPNFFKFLSISVSDYVTYFIWIIALFIFYYILPQKKEREEKQKIEEKKNIEKYKKYQKFEEEEYTKLCELREYNYKNIYATDRYDIPEYSKDDIPKYSKDDIPKYSKDDIRKYFSKN